MSSLRLRALAGLVMAIGLLVGALMMMKARSAADDHAYLLAALIDHESTREARIQELDDEVARYRNYAFVGYGIAAGGLIAQTAIKRSKRFQEEEALATGRAWPKSCTRCGGDTWDTTRPCEHCGDPYAG